MLGDLSPDLVRVGAVEPELNDELWLLTHPDIVALIGLLGMLVGEQIIPVGKQLIYGKAFESACDKSDAITHVFGRLPGRSMDVLPIGT